MSEPVTIDSLEGGDSEAVADFYRTVLEGHFPADELETPESVASTLRSGAARGLVARSAGGQIVGGIICDWFADSQVLLFSYLAVPEACRGRGIATQLMSAMRSTYAADPAPRLIIGEVADPRYVAAGPYGDPVARMRLYERTGSRSLPVPYQQPALRPGASRVPHLLLMVFGGRDAPPGSVRVDGACVAAFLADYYELCEGPPRTGDAAYEAMLAACARPGGLPLLLHTELPQDETAVGAADGRPLPAP
jgi:ribosomal protein S18 acetylase RimI-like enzyme